VRRNSTTAGGVVLDDYWIEAILGSGATCVVPILTTVRSCETEACRFNSRTTWTASAAAFEIRMEYSP
jgi:hypothetical protein